LKPDPEAKVALAAIELLWIATPESFLPDPGMSFWESLCSPTADMEETNKASNPAARSAKPLR
jgi:hypothetical protein